MRIGRGDDVSCCNYVLLQLYSCLLRVSLYLMQTVDKLRPEARATVPGCMCGRDFAAKVNESEDSYSRVLSVPTGFVGIAVRLATCRSWILRRAQCIPADGCRRLSNVRFKHRDLVVVAVMSKF